MLQAIHNAKNKLFAMEKFKRLYTQARTPKVTSVPGYDGGKKTHTLNMNQAVSHTLRKPEMLPVLIAIRTSVIGLIRRAVLLDLYDGASPVIENFLIPQKEIKKLCATQCTRRHYAINTAQSRCSILLKLMSTMEASKHLQYGCVTTLME